MKEEINILSSLFETLNKKDEIGISRIGAFLYFLKNILIIFSVPVLTTLAWGYFLDEREWVVSARSMPEVIRIFNESVFFFFRVVFWGPMLETVGQIIILVVLSKWIKSELYVCLIFANLAALLHLTSSINSFVFITLNFYVIN